jgi:hypothetical protein
METPTDRYITFCAQSKYPPDEDHMMKKVIVPIMKARADPNEVAHRDIKDA